MAILATILLFSLAVQRGFAQEKECHSQCAAYNQVLWDCQNNVGQDEVYKYCVCQNADFTKSAASCSDCLGADSTAARMADTCKSVPSDCASNCKDFVQVLTYCNGDAGCMCGNAYAAWDQTTFAPGFDSCAVCEEGRGIAGRWEGICCARTGACNTPGNGTVSPLNATATGTTQSQATSSQYSGVIATGAANALLRDGSMWAGIGLAGMGYLFGYIA